MSHTDLATVLRERGLLLLADTTLPSVATLVAGEPIRGSWWGHPKSHEIFRAGRQLAGRSDAVAIPLVSGKVTFVHRRLWPALLTVALSRERWQTAGLPAAARALLRRVEKAGEIEASGPAVRDLERRLLVLSREVHTDAGAHAKAVERWDRWAARASVAPLPDVAAARRALEEAAAALAADPGRIPALPWRSARVAR